LIKYHREVSVIFVNVKQLVQLLRGVSQYMSSEYM